MEKNLNALVKANANVLGVGSGLALSPLIGPGAALAVGGLLSAGFERVAQACLDQSLQPRVRDRSLEMVRTALSDLVEAEERGSEPRNDGFLDGGEESHFAACLEHAFMVARDDVTGRKAVHIGHLVAALPYRTDIDLSSALYLMSLAADLNLAEYHILGVASRRSRYSPDSAADGHPVLLNMMERVDAIFRLVRYGGEKNVPTSLNPRHLCLSDLGELLFDLLKLTEMNSRDIDDMEGRFLPYETE